MVVYKYAGFWRRLVAYIIDNVIINIAFFILLIIAVTSLVLGSMSSNSRTWVADLVDPLRLSFTILIVFVFYFVLMMAYFTYFHGMKGRTPGKMMLGLQVLSTDGTPITFGIAFLRSVGYLVSSALLNIGFIWAAFDGKKQGWHDKIAGTVVIIRPQENEAAGLTIPEPAATLNIPPTVEKQAEENTSATVIPPIIPAEGENKAIAEPPGINDQKMTPS
jgi:uncharacterized RDD family membrane protein YckC